MEGGKTGEGQREVQASSYRILNYRDERNSTENVVSGAVVRLYGDRWSRNRMCRPVESPYCSPEVNVTLCVHYISI